MSYFTSSHWQPVQVHIIALLSCDTGGPQFDKDTPPSPHHPHPQKRRLCFSVFLGHHIRKLFVLSLFYIYKMVWSVYVPSFDIVHIFHNALLNWDPPVFQFVLWVECAYWIYDAISKLHICLPVTVLAAWNKAQLSVCSSCILSIVFTSFYTEITLLHLFIAVPVCICIFSSHFLLSVLHWGAMTVETEITGPICTRSK